MTNTSVTTMCWQMSVIINQNSFANKTSDVSVSCFLWLYCPCHNDSCDWGSQWGARQPGSMEKTAVVKTTLPWYTQPHTSAHAYTPPSVSWALTGAGRCHHRLSNQWPVTPGKLIFDRPSLVGYSPVSCCFLKKSFYWCWSSLWGG